MASLDLSQEFESATTTGLTLSLFSSWMLSTPMAGRGRCDGTENIKVAEAMEAKYGVEGTSYIWGRLADLPCLPL